MCERVWKGRLCQAADHCHLRFLLHQRILFSAGEAGSFSFFLAHRAGFLPLPRGHLPFSRASMSELAGDIPGNDPSAGFPENFQ